MESRQSASAAQQRLQSSGNWLTHSGSIIQQELSLFRQSAAFVARDAVRRPQPSSHKLSSAAVICFRRERAVQRPQLSSHGLTHSGSVQQELSSAAAICFRRERRSAAPSAVFARAHPFGERAAGAVECSSHLLSPREAQCSALSRLRTGSPIRGACSRSCRVQQSSAFAARGAVQRPQLSSHGLTHSSGAFSQRLGCYPPLQSYYQYSHSPAGEF